MEQQEQHQQQQQASSNATERNRLVENRICVHVWRSRRLIHSSTRGKAVHVCEPCLRAWNRQVQVPRQR